MKTSLFLSSVMRSETFTYPYIHITIVLSLRYIKKVYKCWYVYWQKFPRPILNLFFFYVLFMEKRRKSKRGMTFKASCKWIPWEKQKQSLSSLKRCHSILFSKSYFLFRLLFLVTIYSCLLPP